MNARKDEDVKACNVWPLTDVMNIGADLLVGEELCQKILKFPINGVCLHPSIYIDLVGGGEGPAMNGGRTTVNPCRQNLWTA